MQSNILKQLLRSNCIRGRLCVRGSLCVQSRRLRFLHRLNLHRSHSRPRAQILSNRFITAMSAMDRGILDQFVFCLRRDGTEFEEVPLEALSSWHEALFPTGSGWPPPGVWTSIDSWSASPRRRCRCLFQRFRLCRSHLRYVHSLPRGR